MHLKWLYTSSRCGVKKVKKLAIVFMGLCARPRCVDFYFGALMEQQSDPPLIRERSVFVQNVWCAQYAPHCVYMDARITNSCTHGRQRAFNGQAACSFPPPPCNFTPYCLNKVCMTWLSFALTSQVFTPFLSWEPQIRLSRSENPNRYND